MSCKCQQCGLKYKVDLNIPDWLWEKITPKPQTPSAGLLCGSCIMKNIEVFDEYGALYIEKVDLEHNLPQRNKQK